MHPNNRHIHRGALRCLRVAFGFEIGMTAQMGDRPTDDL